MLAYTSNLLPLRRIEDLTGVVIPFFAEVRRRLGWAQLGLDLHLNAVLIDCLAADPGVRDDLRRRLAQAGLLVATINAFPLGAFQEGPVKERVYAPDWCEPARLETTCRLLDLIPALTDQEPVTISTLAGGFRPWGRDRNDLARIAANLGRFAAAAWRLRRERGRRVILCLEPEPFCTLETSAETAGFWAGSLACHGLAAAAEDLGGDRDAADEALRDHLGLCLDVSHASVVFEDPVAAIAVLRNSGVPLVKLQVSACPEATEPETRPEAVEALMAMAEPRFLHQTVLRRQDGSLVRLVDLEALADWRGRFAGVQAIRSHFHVPLTGLPWSSPLRTTTGDCLAALGAARAAGCRHLAVETYTWSILAEREAMLAGVVGELAWLERALLER